MRYLDLCRDRADPRRTCPGRSDARGCRCRGDYRPRFESVFRRAPGDAEEMCPGCGHVYVGPPEPVTVWTACAFCGTDWRVAGTSPWRTLLWRLFGRREGHNRWDMCRAETRYRRRDLSRG